MIHSIDPGDRLPAASKSSPSEAWIDETLMQSFPASDAPGWTLGTAHPDESSAAPAQPGNTP